MFNALDKVDKIVIKPKGRKVTVTFHGGDDYLVVTVSEKVADRVADLLSRGLPAELLIPARGAFRVNHPA